MTNKMYTIKEAAKLLTISPSTLYCWVSKRKVPCHRLGSRSLRFTVEDLASIIEMAKVDVAEQKPERYEPRERLKHIKV